MSRAMMSLAVLAMETSWLMLAATRDPATGFPAFAALFLILFGIYGLLILGMRKGVLAPPSLGVLWIGAILFRLTLLPSEPVLSDDLYRYLWEGRIQTQGFNPFLHAPEAAELEQMRDAIYDRVNHPAIPTIYPPLMQMLFWSVSSLYYATWTMKAVMVLFDLGTLALVLRLLRRSGRNPGLAVIYAWSPLVILEFAGSGHNDSVFLFFVVLGMGALGRARPVWAAVALAGSILSKVAGIVYVPVFLRRAGWRWIMLVPLLVLLCYLPYIGAGTGLFRGLVEYGRRWEFNGSLFRLLAGPLGSGTVARTAFALAGAVLVLAIARRNRPLGTRLLATTGVLLLFSPTVHPWYVTWLVPLLCFAFRWPWLLWSGTVVLAYHVRGEYEATGVWSEAAWVGWVEYLPVYLGLALGAWWRWRGWARDAEDL